MWYLISHWSTLCFNLNLPSDILTENMSCYGIIKNKMYIQGRNYSLYDVIDGQKAEVKG